MPRWRKFYIESDGRSEPTFPSPVKNLVRGILRQLVGYYRAAHKAAVDHKAYNGADIVQEEAITVPQAVRLYTARLVELAPYQDVLGQIAEGFEASFVVLDQDIFTIDVEEIDQTVVQQTWIRGEKVYECQ